MPRQRPRRVDHLDQPLERQLGMGVSRKVAPPYPPDQLAHTGVARHVGAQHQRVDEEAHQVVQRSVAAPGDRAADRDVGAGPKPAQQPGKPGLQHHEQARPALPRQPRKPAVQIGPNSKPDPAAAMARDLRPRPVRRQLDLLGQVGQRRRPVRQLPRQRARCLAFLAQHLPLPQRVVGILHRQRRQPRRGCDRSRIGLWRPVLTVMVLALVGFLFGFLALSVRLARAGAARPVECAKIPRQRPKRPAVAGDVVQQQHQNVQLRCIGLRSDGARYANIQCANILCASLGHVRL